MQSPTPLESTFTKCLELHECIHYEVVLCLMFSTYFKNIWGSFISANGMKQHRTWNTYLKATANLVSTTHFSSFFPVRLRDYPMVIDFRVTHHPSCLWLTHTVTIFTSLEWSVGWIALRTIITTEVLVEPLWFCPAYIMYRSCINGRPSTMRPQTEYIRYWTFLGGVHPLFLMDAKFC